MQNRITVTLNKISFQQGIDIETLLDIFKNHPYLEEDGVGFTNALIRDGIIEAKLLKRTPTSLQEYDINSGDFIQRDIFIFDEIDFFIDLTTSFIYTFGSSSKLNKVKSIIKSFIEVPISYDNVAIRPDIIIDELSSNGFSYSIKEIVIKKFIYEQGAQGRYAAQIINPQTGKKLLNDYSDEIHKISFNVASNDYSDFTLTTSTSNTICIKSEDDDFYSILDEFKNIIR